MTKFSDLKLDPKVLKAIAEAGYETPTPIQAGAIPHALEGRDVLGIAQTGTGKTASFTLPMITLLGRGRARARMPRSLVLCPTRELAAQVAENFDTYAKHTKLTKALLIGGVSFAEQDKLIDRGVDVLIATPGRLLDHFERGKLLLTGVQIMVVDEADRMLDMGFIPDIERIFQLTPFTRQTLFFSATMAPEIERITNTFLHSPERIEVARQATTGENITQRLVEITPTRRDQTAKQKRELLRALIDAEGEALKNAIIFCNRKTDVDIVAKSLKKHGYDAAPIHGDLDQSQRMRTLDEFREGKLRFLIASDVAARGLDIPAVSHVINFDLPSHSEDYVHRIGRTGRAGRKGTAISLATPSDEKYLSGIENLVMHALPRGEVPEGFSLSEASHSAPRGERRDDRRGERGGRGRNRDRGDRERREDRPRDETRSEARSESRPQPEVREQERSAPRNEPRQERGQQDRSQQDRGFDGNRDGNRRDRDGGRDGGRDRNRDGGRDNHRDNYRDRRRDHDRGPEVMGMGSHVPEFMTQSFRPVEFPPETAVEVVAEVIAAPVAETVAAEAPAAAEKPAAKPKRNRRKKAEPAAEAASDATPETAAVEAVAAAEAAPVAETPAEVVAEKPKRAPRSRKKPVTAEAAEAAPAEAAAEAPEKPKRTRRKKAEVAAEAPAEAAAEAAPEKPKRTRRKKVDETPAETA
ncbi:DEAD/DEAH box helicase [uncultured Paracoccus sp.]|uniref:DEAD/DEAH box helicase n=1 Tax=uncultured Paracoccus sp. TaxID=189685 RepID=UPI0034522F5B